MKLKDRVALVTGGGVRVGAAIATELASAGCHVAMHYAHSEEGARDTARIIRSTGREVEIFHGDLMDAEDARTLPQRVHVHFGRLDVVVNSAAIMIQESVEEVTPASWDQVMNLNLRAYFFVAQGAVQSLRDARGTIINIAGVASFEPWPSYITHSVSKAGVSMLTKVLARALAPEIRVNAVAPGPVLLPEGWSEEAAHRTVETTPLKRLGVPADVSRAVRFLVESGDFMTGSTLVVDGGRLVR